MCYSPVPQAVQRYSSDDWGSSTAAPLRLALCRPQTKPFLPEIGVRTLSLRRNGCQVLGADLIVQCGD